MNNSHWAHSQPEVVTLENTPHHFAPIQNDKFAYNATPGQPPIDKSKHPRWKVWTVLLLSGIFIAIIAGLIGGFIGKAIQSNQNSSATTGSNAQRQGSTCSSSAPAPSPSSSQAVTTLPVPTTGCPSTNNTLQRSNETGSTFFMLCNTDWISFNLVSGYMNSVSDCVEACVTFNRYMRTNNGTYPCVGTSFVPSWLNNRTLGIAASDTSGNCFLKYRVNILVAPPYITREAVSMCLTTAC